MATIKKEMKKKAKKDMLFFSLFTMNETKTGKKVLTPKLNKFGVKKILVTTNDGEEIELDENTALWAKKFEGTSKEGKEYSFYDVSLGIEA